ncbi:MAG: hypothetical protein QQN63_12085 [Nitrosopumilus sp.]
MGYIMATSACYGCKCIFSYNPQKVPSIRIDGVREPVCELCIMAANRQREKLGLDLHVIHSDAYKPIPEAEL